MASGEMSGSLAISEANNHLAVHLYQLLAKEGTNVFFSPFSVSVVLAMLFCGSESETADEMRQVLGYEVAKVKDQDIKLSFQRLLSAVKSNAGDDYTLAFANLLMSQTEFSVKDEFKSILEESFEAKLKSVDFRNESQNAIQQVNNWVKEKTNNMIPKFIDSLDESTVMILLNAVYFKGLWLNQFKEKNTFQQAFYNNGLECNAKTVQMMHLKAEFPYSENESFKALQLPYRGNNVSMLILLPNSINGLGDLESSLDSTSLNDLLQDLREREVDVALPKFRLEYSKSLKEHFQSMGMERLFEPGADFGAISDSKKLLISDIIHKAVVEVNEEGSEAAAVTGMMMVMCSLPLPLEFIANHPFLFVIYDTNRKLILFMGKVNEL